MTGVNFAKMKRDLIDIYKSFIRNPEDEKLQKKIRKYEVEYGGLSVYNDMLKSQPVPVDVETALNGLSTIYQYGMHPDDHPAFSNDGIINEAKKILNELKKSEK